MNSVLTKLLSTEANTTALFVRIILAFVIFPHGAQKMLGWFGGYGFTGTMEFFTGTMGIPWIFALTAILAEFVGPIALLFGLETRMAAAAISVNMIVAALTSHLQHGFFMDWFRNQKGEGFEYHIVVLGLCAVLLLQGGGSASVDKRLQRELHPAT